MRSRLAARVRRLEDQAHGTEDLPGERQRLPRAFVCTRDVCNPLVDVGLTLHC